MVAHSAHIAKKDADPRPPGQLGRGALAGRRRRPTVPTELSPKVRGAADFLPAVDVARGRG